jgi:DNA-binding transcriptional ArsR family regulator
VVLSYSELSPASDGSLLMLSERATNFAAIVVVVLLALIGISLYIRNLGDSHTNVDPLPPFIPQPSKESTVRRDRANVLLGTREDISLTTLSDDEWHSLEDKGRVATDANGEGLLNFKGCMSIHLFHDSELTTAPCSKAEYKSGNVICSVAGTSAFNNSCNSRVIIQTDSAEILLNGTWLTVTYLPSRQLSLISVKKGGATVWPVKNVTGWIRAEPIELKEGQYCYSSPGEIPRPINGLPQRQPLSQETLPKIDKELKLTSWLGNIEEKAKQDNVSTPRASVAGDSRGNANVTPATAGGGDAVGHAMGGRRYDLSQRILRALGNREMTKVEIARRLGLTDAVAERWLNRLLKARKIETTKNKPVRYRQPAPAQTRRH